MNMFGRKYVILLILYLIVGLFVPRISYAITEPTFQSCANALAPVKIAYDYGTHGIPGNMGEYKGRDTVYYLSDANLLQCFCSTEKQGIQTNWWKANALSDPDIETMKNLGWIYIPNGELWGLENTPYLAKNSTYDCGGGVGGGSVLGLASTGGTASFYVFIVISIISLIAGVIVARKK